MQLNHLKYFVVTVDLQSMNRAARKLDITPPTLHAGIVALERELGFSLLNRSRLGVLPTANGQIVYADAVKMLEMQESWRGLREDVPKDCLPLGANTAIMRLIVPKVLLKLHSISPNLELVLHESYMEEIFSTIMDKRMLGIINNVSECMKEVYQMRVAQNNMAVIDMGEDPCVVIINKTNPLARQQALKLNQLKQLHLVWNPMRLKHFCYRDIYQHFSNAEPLLIPDQDNLLHMVSIQNDVAAVLPASALRARPTLAQYIVGMQVSDFPMPGRIWVIYPVRLSNLEKTVLNVISEVFREEMQ